MHDNPRPVRMRPGDQLRRCRPTGSRTTRSHRCATGRRHRPAHHHSRVTRPPHLDERHRREHDPLLPPTGAGAEREGGDGAKPASSAHPRRAPPPRIPAGMPGFDGRGGGVRHGWGRRASASAGLNGRRHASFPGGDASLVLSAFCFRLAGFPNGSGRPELPCFWFWPEPCS